MPELQKFSLTKLCDGPQTAVFCVIFASCIASEPRAAHFRHAFYIRTKATPCVEVWQPSSNQRPLRLGEKKKDRRRNHRAKI